MPSQLRDCSLTTLREIRDILDSRFPTTPTSPKMLGNEQGRMELAQNCGQRAVIDELDRAIKMITKESQKVENDGVPVPEPS